jgi:hypothetical protein
VGREVLVFLSYYFGAFVYYFPPLYPLTPFKGNPTRDTIFVVTFECIKIL